MSTPKFTMRQGGERMVTCRPAVHIALYDITLGFFLCTAPVLPTSRKKAIDLAVSTMLDYGRNTYHDEIDQEGAEWKDMEARVLKLFPELKK